MKYEDTFEHWQYMLLELKVFKAFIEMFNKDLTLLNGPMQDKDSNAKNEMQALVHEDAQRVLRVLTNIKQMDRNAYKTLTIIYENELRDIITEYNKTA